MSRTEDNNGYYHVSVPDGDAMLDSLALANDWEVVHVTSGELFREDTTPSFDVLYFQNAAEDPLTAEQQNAIIAHVQAGKGVVAVHSGTFLWKDWDWWVAMMGGLRHTGGYGRRLCDVTRLDTTHLSMRDNPDLYQLEIEWYYFDGEEFNEGVHILERSEMPDTIQNIDPPLEPIEGPTSWCHHYDGGRAWMTQHGHFTSNYQNPVFAHSVYGAVVWAADTDAAGCGLPETVSINWGAARRFEYQPYLKSITHVDAYDVMGRRHGINRGKSAVSLQPSALSLITPGPGMSN